MWDCLDGLAALLTFHSVPDCNPGDGGGVHSPGLGWMFGRTGGRICVGQSSLLLSVF